MRKEVTLPLVLAGLTLLGMMYSGACVWHKDLVNFEHRSTFKQIFWLLVGVLIACIAWHIWLTRSRPDLQLDILAALFPSEPIHQLGACQVRIDMQQIVNRLQVVVLLQNRFDQAVKLSMQFPAEGGEETLYREITPLEVLVPASGCIMARIRQPLEMPCQPVAFSIKPFGSCWPPLSARQVRFKRGDALQTEMKGWISLLGFFPVPWLPAAAASGKWAFSRGMMGK